MARLEQQWGVPAGFDSDGRMITLDQLISRQPAPIAMEELTHEQRVALTRKRWEAGEWEDVFIGSELVDLSRAKHELEAKSELADTLLEASEGALARVIRRAREARGLA